MAKKEKRRYIRISTVLPVEFFLADKNGKKITPWLQGFTCDIGKGGICLTVNDLWWGFWDRFQQPGNKIFLRISFPFKKNSLFFESGIRWLDSIKLKKFHQYRVGLEFTGAKKKGAGSIFRFALFKKIAPVVVGLVLTFSFLFSAFFYWQQARLARDNRRLVNNYGEILERNSYLARVLSESKEAEKFFLQRQEDLTKKIEKLQENISGLESEYESLKEVRDKDKEQLLSLAALEDRLKVLNQELESLRRENNFLKERVSEKEKVVEEIRQETKRSRVKRDILSGEVIAGMYDWIRHRQDLRRGLVLSYEGDSAMDKVCFTYDQALSVFVFLSFNDKERAAKILDFYLDLVNRGQSIHNGYFTDGGVFEYVVHSGPKAWLGLAVLSYTKKTGNKKYLKIAEHVADFLIQMQDKEGGIVGGPEVDWYSTEHNLDAYAFFRMFYQVTQNPKYKEKSLQVKDWLTRYAYTDHKVPVKRGKGDATIATDTYAWSVTALGPDKLYSLGMDPEMILEFAAKKCKVTVNFERQDGKEVKVEGFDFAKARNIGRGGVVSGEWTAQMILAYQVMADYFKDSDAQRYRKYSEKALFYANELQKMLIVSPSRAGRVDPSLPYASDSFVSTGHGWRTPRGNRTGSLASTAYFLLTYKGYNPLRAEYLNVSLEKEYKK